MWGQFAEIPCIFPVKQGSHPETGSQQTASSATKSCSLSDFQRMPRPPAQMAAFRGPLRRAALQAGPGERNRSVISAAGRNFSPSRNSAVRFGWVGGM